MTEGGNGKNKPPDGTASVAPEKAAEQDAASVPAAAGATPQITPQAAQALQSLVQLGIFSFPPAQQSPEAIRHITGFLTQDSNNRLQAVTEGGKRNHTFRMSALGIGAGLMVLIVVVPLIVQLYRGDMSFVDRVLSSY